MIEVRRAVSLHSDTRVGIHGISALRDIQALESAGRASLSVVPWDQDGCFLPGSERSSLDVYQPVKGKARVLLPELL